MTNRAKNKNKLKTKPTRKAHSSPLEYLKKEDFDRLDRLCLIFSTFRRLLITHKIDDV